MKPVAIVVILALVYPVDIGRAAPTTAPTGPGELVWLDSLDEAYKQAQREQRPILVYVGANWCKPCHALREEMGKPAAREKLARWTRVYIDVDKSAAAAQALGVSALPALRVVTPAGAVGASTEGFMSADELIAWLDASGQAPANPPGEEFVGQAAPDDAALAKLLEALTSGSPTLHEAAVRRLAPHPNASAARVVDLVVNGSLASRLAALELLEEWSAPIDGIDPWHLETLTHVRVELLRKWSAAPTTRPTTRSSADHRADFDALLAAPTDAAAIPIRERLARRGDAIRSELDARLQAPGGDQQRTRLLALRLRLASTDRLALTWPNGYERLASADAQVRRDAMTDLATRATPDDQPLFLQLFASSDPYIREASLRLIRTTVGGESAAIATLLSDPEANVRAAVLKQFAEDPDQAVVALIVKYVATETDVDLLVHAIRVLRASKHKAAAECLIGMLGNDSWRVRAEAVEALHELSKDTDAQAVSTSQVSNALRKLLDDADGYVVSRAILGLLDSDDASLMKPIFVAAEKHPELLPEMIASLGKANASMQSAAAPELRKLVEHESPAIGAAALRALCSSEGQEPSKLILDALTSESAELRLAAADGLVSVARTKRPRNGYVTRSKWGGFSSEQVQVDPVVWLSDWLSNKGRPKWMSAATPALEKMLASSTASERGSAALALIVLGRTDPALKLLFDQSAGQPELRPKMAAALGWLPLDVRVDQFNALLARKPGEDAIVEMVRELADPPDARSTDALWALVASPDSTPQIANSVLTALRELYFGQQYYNASQLPKSTLKKAIDATSQRASQGADMQRLVALAILLIAAPDNAATVAAKTVADPASSESARVDALHVALLGLPQNEAEKAAVDAIGSPHGASTRKVAVMYLAGGQEAIQNLRGSIYLYNPRATGRVLSSSAVVINPPAGITVAQLKPLLVDSDAALAASAGYLLATLGDRSGLDKLIKHWRGHPNDRTAKEQVYRAIAVLDDDTLTPILTEIFNSYDKNQRWEISPFYWTIRSMHGPQVLKLRKKIRDEVGMEQLR